MNLTSKSRYALKIMLYLSQTGSDMLIGMISRKAGNSRKVSGPDFA